MKNFNFFLSLTFFLSLKLHFLHSSTIPSTLLSIKSSFKDPLNTFHDWDFSQVEIESTWCSWSGIKCDKKNENITSLDLSCRNLSGTISPEIKHLSHLIHLNLSRNELDGPLQQAVFELSNLETLDVSDNLFNSTFPSGISNVKSLSYLNGFNNNFTGVLPEEIVYLKNLEFLNLGGSYFDGGIPASYGGFSRLKFLYLAGNLLTGLIPGQLGELTEIEHLELGYNKYSGEFPAELCNLSSLIYLDISTANLSGEIPDEIGNLRKLETLLLYQNHFVGEIPNNISQLISLKVVDLSDNDLLGMIPSGFSGLKELTTLSLMNNKLTGEIPEGFDELPNLEKMSLWNNSLSGILPQKLGSNAKLKMLDVSTNLLSGPIPTTLCLSNKLVKLILFSNKFIGELPLSLAKCTTLIRIRVQNNRLNGSIPLGFGFLPNLAFMDISKNNFTGPIPKDFTNAVKLEYLNLSSNSFHAELPYRIWSAPSLQIFSANSAGLVSKIPDFIGCRSLYKIELEGNNLTGNIPWDIDHCKKLIHLNLRKNALTGIIPWEISRLPVITDIDLSHNYLTGTIPSNFDNCSTLESFNVSYNQLTGPVPSSGSSFLTLHPSSFLGNEGLCGVIIRRPCRTAEAGAAEVQQKPKKTSVSIIWITAAALGIGLFILIVGTRCLRANHINEFSAEKPKVGPWKLTAFQRLNFSAQDVLECLTMSDEIIGMGSAGTVYKVEMPNGEIIAVKKLWAKNKETVRKRRGVLAEVEVLGHVRHRNIVKLLGCCSNNECTMLLYEYMPNGSLDDLLHGKNKGENLVSDWLVRYKIALNVAEGIRYLHHDCDPVIVHRDLKPSNILLDIDMEARVADFGVAKLIQSDDESMSVIAGSYGYIAPEYAYTLQVDEKSDIYSYGVLLMEMLTGKRSVDAEFGDGNSIVDWLRSKIKAKVDSSDVLDKNATASRASVREEMMLVLRIALLCTSRNPVDRPSMRDVVSMLREAEPKGKLPADDGKGAGGEIGIGVGGDVIP